MESLLSTLMPSVLFYLLLSGFAVASLTANPAAEDLAINVDSDLVAGLIEVTDANPVVAILEGELDEEGEGNSDRRPSGEEVRPARSGGEMETMIDKLSNENRLFEEMLKRSLREEMAEIRRMETEVRLAEQRLKKELVDREGMIARERTELNLRRAEAEAQVAEMEAMNRRMAVEMENQRRQLETEMQAISQERERLAAERSLAEERNRARLAEIQAERDLLAANNALRQESMREKEMAVQAKQTELQESMIELDLRNKVLSMERMEGEAALTRIDSELRLLRAQRNRRSTVESDLAFPEVPFENGVLRISDRRIPLNGPIISGTGNHITRRIHFFNNQSKTEPIFIVIDSCPGGSAMEGYLILKAMEASEAPVHVVVKSFAASMAAIITTRADHSYAFPNAIILHHQPMSAMSGNLTEQREAVRTLEEWSVRLLQPVAEKMDLTLEELVVEMYNNRSTGDWFEFADKARELRWVNDIVTELREESILERPTDRAPVPWWMALFGQADASEVEFLDREYPKQLELPPLRPFDSYLIHNPNGLYVW